MNAGFYLHEGNHRLATLRSADAISFSVVSLAESGCLALAKSAGLGLKWEMHTAKSDFLHWIET